MKSSLDKKKSISEKNFFALHSRCTIILSLSVTVLYYLDNPKSQFLQFIWIINGLNIQNNVVLSSKIPDKF